MGRGGKEEGKGKRKGKGRKRGPPLFVQVHFPGDEMPFSGLLSSVVAMDSNAGNMSRS